jgi:hypothetical protein
MEFVADLIILMVLLSAIYIGIARGLWGPLMTEGAFLAAFLIDIWIVMPVVSRSVTAPFRTFIGILVFFALGTVLRFLLRPIYIMLQRLPITRRIHEPAGAVLHGFVAFVVMYLILGVILDFDRHVYPIVVSGVATAQAIDDLQQAVTDRPYLAGVVNQNVLKDLKNQALPKPISQDALRTAEHSLDNYITWVRDPLIASHLAPIINSVGGKLPFIGHQRPYLEGAKYA